MNTKILALVAFAAAVSFADGAMANGCNGHVDQLRWGCAAWDNNNGPQFPYYKAPARPAPTSSVPAPVAAAGSARPAIGTTSGNGIISTNSGGIVASGAGNIVASGAGNIISNDGASRKPH